MQCSERSSALFETLIASSKEDRERLHKEIDKLQESLVRLRDGVQIASFDEQAQDQFRQLIGIHQDATDALKQVRIIRSLHFEDIRRRYEGVEEAHAKTFAWIMGDPEATVDEGPSSSVRDGDGNSPPGDEDDASFLEEEGDASSSLGYQGSAREIDDRREALRLREDAKTRFWNWIASPGGMFHISGKLGSGKSTLMKLLVENEEIQAGLKRWAGECLFLSPVAND